MFELWLKIRDVHDGHQSDAGGGRFSFLIVPAGVPVRKIHGPDWFFVSRGRRGTFAELWLCQKGVPNCGLFSGLKVLFCQMFSS